MHSERPFPAFILLSRPPSHSASLGPSLYPFLPLSLHLSLSPFIPPSVGPSRLLSLYPFIHPFSLSSAQVADGEPQTLHVFAFEKYRLEAS